MQKIIFDTETNGLNNCSILSFSALILDGNNNIKEIIDRYYFRELGEEPCEKAIAVNGLTDAVIKANRDNCNYPIYFHKDEEIFSKIKSSDILICHNVSFDLGHIKRAFKYNFTDKKTFCTMKALQYVYNAPYFVNGQPKFPKLSEALEYYNIDPDILREKLNLDFHNSLFDVYCTYEIYKKIAQDKQEILQDLQLA